jgi:hypothetical protein
MSSVFQASQVSGDQNFAPLEVGYSGGLWYVIAGRKTPSASIADYIFFSGTGTKKMSDRVPVTDLTDVVNRKFEANARPVRIISVDDSGKISDSGFPVIMVDTRTGELMKGSDYNLGNSLDSFIENGSRVSMYFPHPYHPELDFFVRSLFLTRGLMLKPPLKRKFIMENLVEETYQHSVGVRRETIRKDFNEMLMGLIASKVFHVKGGYLTYLTDLTEYRRRYQRLYLPYAEKISKRTIFDYERSLHKQS